MRCAVLTVSDTRRGSADTSGALIQTLIERAGHEVIARAFVRDDRAAIRRAARTLLGRRALDVLVVTGGTGVAPRDVTPEALLPLCDRLLPGFGERFRALSHVEVGNAAWLSRAEAGVTRDRLVVLLPGSSGAVRLALSQVLLPEISHVIRTLGRFQAHKE
ncbi:MAG TPA: MogA/MoaB family molybdenum cofactor biosynthesis protein [Candidatus Udaeobacter sp.]|nr:MogA/MoaB family molybdenum cofactor biosynthesis protein [Candidatus Udaeobacter sp.]